MKTLKDLETYLIDNGFNEYPIYSPKRFGRIRRLWIKKLKTNLPCIRDKYPMLLVLYAETSINDKVDKKVKITLRDQVDIKTGVNLEAFYLSIDHFIQDSEAIEAKLITSWKLLKGEQNGI